MEVLNKKQNFKNAFNCKKCPGSNDENGCPMWWEYQQNNIQSGESRIVKICGYVAMPNFLISVIEASNRPAAEIGSMKNAIIEKIDQFTNIKRLTGE